MTQMTDNTIERMLEQMGKSYRSWKPRQERVEATWNFLVQELNATAEAPATVLATPRFAFSLRSFAQLFHIHALSPVTTRAYPSFVHGVRPVIAILVLGIFGAGSLLKVASASLPGDTLYTVKLVKEAAQVRLAFDEQSRAKLAVQFAVTRADEVRRVVESDETRERKTEQLSVAMAGLEQHVLRATDALIASRNKKEFVSVVEEGTEQIVSILYEAKEEAVKSNGVIAAEVSRALFTMSETQGLVELAVNPPVKLASSVPVPTTIQATAKSDLPKEARIRKIETAPQTVAFTNIAQSVFSLPFAQSVTSEGFLPLATSVGSL